MTLKHLVLSIVLLTCPYIMTEQAAQQRIDAQYSLSLQNGEKSTELSQEEQEQFKILQNELATVYATCCDEITKVLESAAGKVVQQHVVENGDTFITTLEYRIAPAAQESAPASTVATEQSEPATEQSAPEVPTEQSEPAVVADASKTE